MKILICSDTHGDQGILIDKLTLYPNLDHYFYLGDSELADTNQLFRNFIAVSGNMDFGNFPNTKIIRDQGTTFFLTHGHLFSVNSGLDKLFSEAKKVNADIVCYGHTHLMDVSMIDGIIFINPGSISQPRNFISEGGTYAILDITDQDYQVNIYNRNDELLHLESNPIIFPKNIKK